MNSIEVRNFTGYRSFLQAYAHDCKQRRSTWTYGMFAKQLGLKDTSSITKIIHGTRRPGPAIEKKIADYFKFSPQEREYFHNLILLEKLRDDPDTASALLEKMGKKLVDKEVFQLTDASF